MRPAGRALDRGAKAGVSARQRFVGCASPRGLHRISYLEWGDPKNERVLVCAHGLTRCARDFDSLAAAMSATCRVVCPDIAGRGDSEWLADPMLYQLPPYPSDLGALNPRPDVGPGQWLGSSKCGLIGTAVSPQAR